MQHPLGQEPELQGRWPNVERWFEAMEARPAYAGFKSDHYTHVHDLPPQLGGCVAGERQQCSLAGARWRQPDCLGLLAP